MDVFSPKIYAWGIGRVLRVNGASCINSSKSTVQNSCFYDTDPKEAIDDVMEEFGLDQEDQKMKGNAPVLPDGAGRVYVDSAHIPLLLLDVDSAVPTQNKCETVLLRSYQPEP